MRAAYRAMMRRQGAGFSHNIAMICLYRQPPGGTFADERMRLAGTDGQYVPGLARFPGDPRARVTSRRDAERKVTANGDTIKGGAVGLRERGISSPAQGQTDTEKYVPTDAEKYWVPKMAEEMVRRVKDASGSAEARARAAEAQAATLAAEDFKHAKAEAATRV